MQRIPLNTSQTFKLLSGLFVVLATVECINLITGRALNGFGVYPRNLQGLSGILFSPWIHGSFWHFASNMLPLIIFSYLLLQHGARRYLYVSVFVWFVSGILVWLFARSTYHVGASGVIYGYFAYLLVAGFISKELKLMMISVAVGVIYGGMVWGILPSQGRVSFESHLFGMFAGVLAALKWGRVRAVT